MLDDKLTQRRAALEAALRISNFLRAEAEGYLGQIRGDAAHGVLLGAAMRVAVGDWRSTELTDRDRAYIDDYAGKAGSTIDSTMFVMLLRAYVAAAVAGQDISESLDNFARAERDLYAFVGVQPARTPRDNSKIRKLIVYCGKPQVVACDARCGKAWGINNRPKVLIDPKDEDDYAYLSDQELGAAPADPGTEEGGHAKPTTLHDRLNKWCTRECERSVMVDHGEDIKVPDFSRRVYNRHDRQRAADAAQAAQAAPTP